MLTCRLEQFQHDADAVICDTGLSSQLKSASYAAVKKMAGEDVGDVPVLMSGAGHDAMAMSHLTKVCNFLFYSPFGTKDGTKILKRLKYFTYTKTITYSLRLINIVNLFLHSFGHSLL